MRAQVLDLRSAAPFIGALFATIAEKSGRIFSIHHSTRSQARQEPLLRRSYTSALSHHRVAWRLTIHPSALSFTTAISWRANGTLTTGNKKTCEV
jgi:hypothetical protein